MRSRCEVRIKSSVKKASVENLTIGAGWCPTIILDIIADRHVFIVLDQDWGISSQHPLLDIEAYSCVLRHADPQYALVIRVERLLDDLAYGLFAFANPFVSLLLDARAGAVALACHPAEPISPDSQHTFLDIDKCAEEAIVGSNLDQVRLRDKLREQLMPFETNSLLYNVALELVLSGAGVGTAARYVARSANDSATPVFELSAVWSKPGVHVPHLSQPGSSVSVGLFVE
jgi:DNA-binding transcriptional LysR family regulator